MVSAEGRHVNVTEVTVFYASASLLSQVLEWVRASLPIHLRLVSTTRLDGIARALDAADVGIVDATEDPTRVIWPLESGVARIGRERIAVYTARMHEGLEVVTRSLGAQLLLGPLTMREWRNFFEAARTCAKHAADEARKGLPPGRGEAIEHQGLGPWQ